MTDDTPGIPTTDRLPTGLDETWLERLKVHSEHLVRSARRSNHMLVMKAVMGLSCEDRERGFTVPGEDDQGKGFTNTEVADRLGWSVDSEGRRRTINQTWNKIIQEYWPRYSEGFNQKLADEGCPWTIEPDQHQSKGGAPTVFFWRFSVPSETKEPKQTPRSPTDQSGWTVKYYPDEIEAKKGVLSKLLKQGMKRRGRLHIGILITTFLILLVTMLLVMIAFSVTGTLTALVSGVFFIWIFLRFVGWMNRYVQGPMIPAPEIMQTGLHDDLLLEWKTDSMDGDPREHMRLYFSRYSGSCPICDSTVRACDGGSEFPGRIIGICEASPVEHIFSFDPKTRLGFPLREWCVCSSVIKTR